ncbi:MAG: hypothetical protein JXB29_08535 [Sedimentisphaerales bacterium]|nr:hypothetical protein [Sedimentisphaerales bacterium]
MENKKLYNKTRNIFISLSLLICLELFLGQIVTADTFYLKDRSVLSGSILEETAEDFLVDNLSLGQIYILREDIIYRETPQADTLSESYTILGRTLEIIANLSRSVPQRRPDVNSFNLLIPGNVLSVIDTDGSDIFFEQRPIGDSDLITIDYGQLSPQTNRITIITRQQGLVQEESGLCTFRLKYILNEDSRIRVIIRYPEVFRLESIKPEPKVKCKGLIVLDQEIRRQQHFTPQVQFIP